MNAVTSQSELRLPCLAAGHGLALIVDDDVTNRLILSRLLSNIGFEVLEAENGERAIEVFEKAEPRPTLVLMDVMMPLMDGYEATKRIKALSGDEFIPIIFLTAMTDQKALARCIEVGGDDFLTKPYNRVILESKIRSLERIRQLQRQSRHLYHRLVREQEIARVLYDRVVTARNVDSPALSSIVRSTDLFSGDVQASRHGPAGDLYVLLGDCTGHGLTAAIAALPAADIFHAMVGKGFSAPQIVDGINRKLNEVLPVGMFMAAQLVVIHRDLQHVTVCNCGMPDIYILDGHNGGIKHRARSGGLPLGIAPREDESAGFYRFPIAVGDRVLLSSDGVVEARNVSGEAFGTSRFHAVISTDPTSAVQRLLCELDRFCEGEPHHDDVSLAEVVISPVAIEQLAEPVVDEDQVVRSPAKHDWALSMTLNGRRLRTADPIPLILDEIQALDATEHHRQPLFTILTELYVNALDHGILGLDSELKSTAEGFENYFTDREQRLESLEHGFVRIEARSYATLDGGVVQFVIEDSGPGFDLNEARSRQTKYAGRGIWIVEALCQSVIYEARGNRVKATFAWSGPR